MRTNARERAIMQIFSGDKCCVATEREVLSLLKHDGLADKFISRDRAQEIYKDEYESIVQKSRRSSRK